MGKSQPSLLTHNFQNHMLFFLYKSFHSNNNHSFENTIYLSWTLEVSISVGQMFGYSNIFKYIWMNKFICQNIGWFFLWTIKWDIYSQSIFPDEYIWIFIRPVSMVTNIFKFSHIPKGGSKRFEMVQKGPMRSKIVQNYQKWSK